MKQNGTTNALLTPEAHGWRLHISGGEDRTVPTLSEAIASIPAAAHIELALPCQSVLLERHKLPATDRGELADMLQLQLEKTLPFPVEDVSHGFEILSQGENESTILSVTAAHSELDQLCAPLRESGRVPEHIGLQALRIAAACPADETTLVLWAEQEQTVVAIAAGGKLAWAQPIASLDAETVMGELPGLLISAELDGVPSDFTAIRVAEDCRLLTEPLAAHFGKKVEPLSYGAIAQPGEKSLTVIAHTGLDLLPAAWKHAARSRHRGEKLKQNLLTAAVVYLLIVAAAFIYLAWTKNQVRKAQQQVADTAPRYAGIAKQIARWDALTPAVEPDRYIIEVMHLLIRDLGKAKEAQPGLDLKFTSLTFNPREWIVKGEGTTDSHFTFTQQLKKDTDLTDRWDMPAPTPPYTPLKDDKVSFTITGKPR